MFFGVATPFFIQWHIVAAANVTVTPVERERLRPVGVERSRRAAIPTCRRRDVGVRQKVRRAQQTRVRRGVPNPGSAGR
mgnify:FL=1